MYVPKQWVAAPPHGANICSLLMDEISLKSHLSYDISKDNLVEVSDNGDKHSSGLIANSALVLMIRGITHNWKKPIAYFLVNESCSPSRLKDIISKALLNLEAKGLQVISVISDQGSNFLSFADELKVIFDLPYFEMRGKKYHAIFDLPHLLKSLRNNLMK